MVSDHQETITTKRHQLAIYIMKKVQLHMSLNDPHVRAYPNLVPRVLELFGAQGDSRIMELNNFFDWLPA